MPKHFRFIDALRGWAFLGVLLVHVAHPIHTLPFHLDTFCEAGARGVQLFFIVSAFTLFYSLAERSNTEKNPVLNFFIRRFFRIVPMFWAAMAIYLFSGLSPAQHTPEGIHKIDVISTLLLVQGWLPRSVNSVIRGDWSISTETMFYCVLPLLFYKIRSLKSSLWLALIAVPTTHLLSLLVRKQLFLLYAGNPNIAYVFSFYWLPAQLPVFCLGIVLYFILAPK